MITIAVCEDEPYFLDQICELLYQYLKDKKIEASVAKFVNGEEFLNSAQNTDIILMDIQLPGLDGMKIIEQLRKNRRHGEVIFITAYQEHVFQAFDVDAINYLLKPIEPARLFAALDKAMERIINRCDHFILLSNGNSFTKIYTKDIRFCEVFNHQVLIHTTTQKYSYTGTLDALEAELDSTFFRCHRSYIVNMNYVISRASDVAYIDGGDKIFISRRKQQQFGQRLLDICRRESL